MIDGGQSHRLFQSFGGRRFAQIQNLFRVLISLQKSKKLRRKSNFDFYKKKTENYNKIKFGDCN